MGRPSADGPECGSRGPQRRAVPPFPDPEPHLQVVVLLGDRIDEQRLTSALGNRADILAHAGLASAQRALRDLRTSVVVVCLRTAQAATALAAIRDVRRSFSRLSIVVSLDVREVDRQLLVQAVHAGAADLILHGIDDGAQVARHVLDNARVLSLAEQWLTELAPELSVPLFPFVRYGLRTPSAADSLEVSAAALGLARRTLSLKLAAIKAPPPRRLFTWTRLLLASSLLSERGRSLHRVALQLHLPSANSLRQLLQRYARVSVGLLDDRTQVRRAVKQAFLLELRTLARPGDRASSAV